jgi:hypothetical protein
LNAEKFFVTAVGLGLRDGRDSMWHCLFKFVHFAGAVAFACLGKMVLFATTTTRFAASFLARTMTELATTITREL